MTLRQLQYVIAVAESGSLSRTAQELYVTQPSLSGAVRELEDEIGFPIFHRGGKGMTPTNDGAEFLAYARQVVNQYDFLLERYGMGGKRKKKFGISTQHYSFALKSFVEMVKHFGTDEYEFAIRETKTREVIDDVATLKSEIGVIYLCDFNRKVLGGILRSDELDFHKLIECDAYVYLWKGHPLAGNKSIRFEELAEYPCLSFEQGNEGYYFAEEILSTNEYPRTIKANDRASILNLMVGLNGYTLCSGIICEELNGDDFLCVPFEADEQHPNSRMEIGYIVKRGFNLSKMGEIYIDEMRRCLGVE